MLSSPSSISVTLKVSAGGDLAGEVEQYVSQALRALPDVRLVQAEARWTLIVLGVLIQSSRISMTGTFILSAGKDDRIFPPFHRRPQRGEMTTQSRAK